MPALLPLLHLQDLTPMIRNHRRRRQECIPSDYIESPNISLRSFLKTRAGTMHFLPTPAKTLPGKFFPERTSFGGCCSREPNQFGHPRSFFDSQQRNARTERPWHRYFFVGSEAPQG